MTLRGRLFGAIGLTLCVVLGILVVFTIHTETARAERLQAHYDAMAEFAAGLANVLPLETPTASLLLSSGPDGEDVPHPQLTSLAVFRVEPDGTPVLFKSYGAIKDDVAVKDRALGLAQEVAASEDGVRDGTAMAVPGPRRLADAGDREGRPTVVFVEIRRFELDPVAAGQVTFLVIVGAGIVLLLMTWFIADRIVTRPLRAIAGGAQRVAEGDYATPVPPSGADEIRKVIVAFNSMTDELGRLHGNLQDRIGQALRRARRTQDSLVIAQRLAATGTLAAGIAHEVNNPLGGMLNAVRSLRTKEMPDERREEYLALVDDGLHRIEATVAKILRFTPHAVAPQALELNDVIPPVLALVRHRVEREQVTLEVELTSEPTPVFGDVYELQQALLNVVLNALDALEEQGSGAPQISISTFRDEHEIRLAVRDNGPGMTEEQVSQAFDLFYTTKEQGKGSGLGLATVHKILDDHGGRVELRPGADGGLGVLFVLPAFVGA